VANSARFEPDREHADRLVTPGQLGEVLRAVRQQAPLVHCLTNVVAAHWTANVLMAVGAAPAMVDNRHEAGGFAATADAVLVNLGTPYDETSTSMRIAAVAGRAADRPWVLDPVAAGGLPWRTDLAAELLGHSPTVVRGNASEILGLVGGGGGHGVDATHRPEAVLPSARGLASEHQTVVAISGVVDHITDGRRLVRVHNGHPWLTRVTGAGCSLGALIAAFTASGKDPLLAATAATAAFTVAAESAAASTRGPGSFAVALLDELHGLTAEQVVERVRLS